MKYLLICLLTISANCYSGENYIVEDLEKEGQVQALKLNYDKKFNVKGGTVTGQSFFSTTTISNANVANANIATANFTGAVNFANQVTISTGLAVSGRVDLSNQVTISTGLAVSGLANLYGTVNIGAMAAQNFANPGYVKIGSLIIQWGSVDAADSASGRTVVITFSPSFSTGAFYQVTANGGTGRFGTVTSPGLGGLTIYQDNPGGTGTGTGFYWFAVGW